MYEIGSELMVTKVGGGYTVEPLYTSVTLETEESGRCGEVAVMGRWGAGKMTNSYYGVQLVYCAMFMPALLYPIIP